MKAEFTTVTKSILMSLYLRDQEHQNSRISHTDNS